MSDKMKPVMFANAGMSKANSAELIAMLTQSEEGNCPAMVKIYRYPLYSKVQLNALLDELDAVLSERSATAKLRARAIIAKERGNGTP